ncbi:MAG: amidase [Xanthobacteraceae bacterium]|nr:MAG: amidase [Xanthobacteraceae bacterium]
MTRSRDRLEQALERIADPQGEGARACLTLHALAARADADAADRRAADGGTLGPLDGVIVTIKDLFDVAGEVTRAGSKLLAREGEPARADALAVKRLRAAGAVIVAKTNMTEFAFSGVGTNPHFGTPGNPADRARVPGGSTSGGAVAVADGMCEIAIGTDTGGSTRVPAALCGIVGFKPSKLRVPVDGAFPLSYSLDSVGPMARTVAECIAADAVLADEVPLPNAAPALAGQRLGLVRDLPLRDMVGAVAGAFEAALTTLAAAGARLVETAPAALDVAARVNARGGIVPAEAFAIHRERLTRAADAFDPNVRARILRAETMSAADYIANCRERIAGVAQMDEAIADFDALVMPTTPIVAPTIAEVAEPAAFADRNMLLLRNTALVNFFDLCAVSLPLPVSGLPCGLMLVGRNGHDHALMRLALAVERVLAR